jgi:D-ribose pyranase
VGEKERGKDFHGSATSVRAGCPFGLLFAKTEAYRHAGTMLKTGILNPHVLELLARIRHTNTLVISDWAFPYWPEIETVDISLCAGIPTVLDVLDLITPVFQVGRIWQAEEFLAYNTRETIARFENSCGSIPVTREPHNDLKRRVPQAIGLIRTGDHTIYGNIILESA